MKTNKVPMRKCVGCMESKPKKELVRIAYYEGVLSLDLTGRAKGRGVYLCKSPKCHQLALKRKAIQRSFEANISAEEIEKVVAEIEK